MYDKWPSGIPKVLHAVVDVRDVAKAFVKALTCSDAAGKRCIVYNKMTWLKEIGAILRETCSNLGFNIAEKDGNLEELKQIAKKNPEAAKIAQIWGRSKEMSNERSKTMLQMEYSDRKDTFRDMVMSMLKLKIIKPPNPSPKL